MKKLIIISVLMFVFIIGAKMSQARPSVAPAPVRIHPISVEVIDEGSEVDPIVEETESAPTSGGSNFLILLAGQCKTVEYTEWSECNHNFGENGIMFRNIIRPTLGNCIPTTNQQVATVSDCNIIE